MSDENKEIAEVQEPSARVIDEKDMKTFWFGDTAIRELEIDSEPWFVARDIAQALGYAKPENAVAAHVDSDDKTSTLIRGTGSEYKSKTRTRLM